MTPNDAQIDLLLRRHAGQARPGQAEPQTKRDSATGHLDADELNAFAEGSLPAAARSRYMSHLVDCDDCRKVASQLAISGGAVVAAEAKNTANPQGYSWWKSLSGFFSPLTLRYAAFAVVLVAVVGVVFLVTRQQRESNFIAQNEPTNQPQVSAVRPANSAPPAGLIQAEKGDADRSAATSTAAASPMVTKPESKVAEDFAPPPAPPPAPKAGQETTEATSPMLAAKKAPEPVTAKSSPGYAPPPPAEVTRAGTISNERQNIPRDVASGPRKSESLSDKSKMIDRSRAGEMPKDSRADDGSYRAGLNQPRANVQREADEKAATGRDADTLASRNRNARESRPQAPATQSAGTGSRNASEEAPETRSAGGRKFRRQGNGWVDMKFKSSMTLKSISRGSSEFDALDSGLRSIAQQISGQVIVVWKNKAYLIR